MLRPADAVRPATPRTNVLLTLPDGRTYEAPIGTTLAEIFRAIGSQEGRPAPSPCAGGLHAVAALVNGRLRDLTAPLAEDAAVVPVTPNDADGARIYRRSLSFLLMTAAAETFPGADVSIEHSATTVGAYFCEVQGHAPFTQDELRRIEARMREIVEADEPIVRMPMSVPEAIEAVTSRGDRETARLLAHRQKEDVVLYSLRGRQDYFQGYMVPSTGCLPRFALHAFAPGFFLQFPHQRRPRALPPITPYPKLFQVYEEAGDWLERLGIRSAGALDDAIAAGRLPGISLVAEALHEARIASIAQDIAARGERVRAVLVAGPSASGKTTFSKRLAVQLVANGRRPLALCLDDYFVDREHTPRDAQGGLDYECLEAVDVRLFNDHLLRLFAGERMALPRYVFKTGRREEGPTVALRRDAIVIVEGIHGLNPALVPDLPPEAVYRVYVSALTQLNLDRHNRVSTTDCRLIRRIVRDAAFRGYTATDTLRRWASVTAGEKVHIFPFQENGDAIFNSALVHELAVLRPLAEPLLLQVQHETPEYLEANRLLSFLQWFLPAPADAVPDNSILREFVGGSILEAFNPWLEHTC
ncbi:MAG: phosphoribulokinase/uridine kinase family protein [Acidobacteria bacterium]|nr:phosphoribulokinase/uridine kinase family protein [Acidobacteriota bacterium]